MKNDQYATPLVIRNGQSSRLHRLKFSERDFDENWLQEILYEYSSIMPFAEIEPAFAGSLPIAREVPTSVGPIDLLYANSNGYISLVETKLWRNPEARRIVVAQIIDYAKDMAGWSYSHLISAINQANKETAEIDPLVALFSQTDEGEFDPHIFIDRVSRNLEKGRFLLAIVGDRIQESVIEMSQFLQQTPHLGYSLELIELAIYRENPKDNQNLIIQPRIIARTKEIIRAIVEIRTPISPSDIRVSLPNEKPATRSTKRKRITEGEFLEELLVSVGQDAVDFATWVFEHAEENELTISWGDAGPMLKYEDVGTGEFFTLGQLHKNGELSTTHSLYYRFDKLGLPKDACLEYYDSIAALIPGAHVKDFHIKSGQFRRKKLTFGKNPGPNTNPPFMPLYQHKEKWFEAINKVIIRIKELLEE